MSATRVLVTAEQLLAEPKYRRCELVEGELVEMSPVGRQHSWLVIRLGSILDNWVRPRGLGVVGSELGFVLTRNPDTVRAPDLYFVTKGKFGPVRGDGFVDGAPELAIEVLSPDDRASEAFRKIQEYLAGGTKLVWIVDPKTDTITVHLKSGLVTVVEIGGEVSGEDVLPGFRLAVSELFL